MHHGGELFGHSDLHLLKDQRTARKGPQAHVLLVGHAKEAGVLRSDVDVPLGDDKPLRETNFPVPVPDGDPRRPLDAARDTHRRGDSQRHRVGEGDLHLALAPLRPQDHHILQLPLGSGEGHPLGAGELPRLAQILHPVQLVAPAEECLQIPTAEVDMPSAGLDLNGHAGHDFLRQAVNLHLL